VQKRKELEHDRSRSRKWRAARMGKISFSERGGGGYIIFGPKYRPPHIYKISFVYHFPSFCSFHCTFSFRIIFSFCSQIFRPYCTTFFVFPASCQLVLPSQPICNRSSNFSHTAMLALDCKQCV
jgi:hypothetical protein